MRSTALQDTGPEEAFDRLARLAATLTDAPFAFITLVDTERSFWKSAIGIDSHDPADRQNTVAESFCQYVVEDDRPFMVGDTAAHPRTRSNPSIEAMGVAAWAGVPFRDPDGHVLGSFCVVDQRTREWSERDQVVLETLAESASAELALRQALRAERLARHDADASAAGAAGLARTLQESLLPPALPPVPGLDVAARYRPAGTGVEVVGDFYDVFQSGREAWHIVIGDVAGKGVGAAKLTALAHYTLRAAAMQSDSPAAALQTLNRALLEQSRENDLGFLTALLLSFTPGPRGVRLVMCSAGHEPPLLKRVDGRTSFVELRGTMLGVHEDPSLTDVTIDLDTGEQLVLYTDGATDAKRGRERFGAARLRDAVAATAASTADGLARATETAVLDYNDGALPDDTAIVALVARSV